MKLQKGGLPVWGRNRIGCYFISPIQTICIKAKGLFYGSTFKQHKGVTDPLYVLADPPCVHTTRAGRAPPKNRHLPLWQRSSRVCDWSANKTLTQNHKRSRLRRSVCVDIALRERGTIISPKGVRNSPSVNLTKINKHLKWGPRKSIQLWKWRSWALAFELKQVLV